MQQSKTFGRRAQASPPPVARRLRKEPTFPPRVDDVPPVPAPPVETAAADLPQRELLSIEQELEEWNRARKIRKRSFREPWRSVSIAAGLGFAATSWVLPDSVANVTQLALGVLTVGSIYAGWRGRNTPLPSSEQSSAQSG
jgi:hypothetical protein